MHRCIALGIGGDVLKRAAGVINVVYRFRAGADKVGWYDLVVDAFIVAEKRSIVLVAHHRHRHHHQHRSQHAQPAPAQAFIPN